MEFLQWGPQNDARKHLFSWNTNRDGHIVHTNFSRINCGGYDRMKRRQGGKRLSGEPPYQIGVDRRRNKGIGSNTPIVRRRVITPLSSGKTSSLNPLHLYTHCNRLCYEGEELNYGGKQHD